MPIWYFEDTCGSSIIILIWYRAHEYAALYYNIIK